MTHYCNEIHWNHFALTDPTPFMCIITPRTPTAAESLVRYYRPLRWLCRLDWRSPGSFELNQWSEYYIVLFETSKVSIVLSRFAWCYPEYVPNFTFKSSFFIGWIWTRSFITYRILFWASSGSTGSPRSVCCCGIPIIIYPGRWSTWDVRVFEAQPFFRPCANAVI